MKIEEKDQFIRPVRLETSSLKYSEIISELKNVFLKQKDIDIDKFNKVIEASRYKAADFLEQHPTTYVCELLRTVLLFMQEEEKNIELKDKNSAIINKTINHIKDLFIDMSYENKTDAMYVFFAYILGMLEKLDISE